MERARVGKWRKWKLRTWLAGMAKAREEKEKNEEHERWRDAIGKIL